MGHKGAARLATPNTLEGIAAAHAVGVDAVEFDVVADAEGRLALGHDRDEAARRATSLDAALELLASPPYDTLRVLLDVKAPRIAAPLVAAVHDHGLTGRVLVCARQPAVLASVRAHDADVPRGWSLRWPWHARLLPSPPRRSGAGVAGAVAAALEAGAAEAIMLHHTLVTPATVAAVHGAGAPLYAWTVNFRGRLRRLAALGVDAVITDDPRVFRPR